MAPKLGYLLPTRESIMEGRPDAAPLLTLAARAEALGFDSVWVGDSLLARPRHEPLTLLAGVAGRVPRVELGTAVLLPALRNPVLLAHQVATVDQVSEGRLILGVGFASDLPNIRAEHAAAGVPWDKRLGRMMEGLRLAKAFWTGEPVDWDGRWQVKGGVLAPTPYRPGGPPLWIGGNLPASLERAGRFFDGWFPNKPDHAEYAAKWGQIRDVARAAGRDPDKLTGAAYLTLALDEDAARADARLNAFLEHYYGQPAAVLRARQVCYGGPAEGAAAWLAGYAQAGASHLVLRFAGDHERQMEAMTKVRRSLGW
ncbi:MAG TPA: LLM class flavin-dependent oxidoreductase [Acetobacteraceae bacterium]|jgi:alkanesulfonate monooxygenase SsuD/methylene tetrahydromethanopterin reductase-like flavin-dependent oxidoreductase (luciferase family)